jgi:hypothetical protein
MEAVMPEATSEGGDKATHPRCSSCTLPMWLVEIDGFGTAQQHHFECKICDKKIVMPAALSAA